MEQLLRKKEVAEYLNVSIATVDRFMKDQIIPYIKFQKTVRFKKSEIDKVIETRSVK